LYRALSNLSNAKIIQFDPITQVINALPEAHIMTKHMIKFNTMVLLMRLPHNCDTAMLYREISACEELQKPVR
jgi:hypothetical protein